MPKLTLKYLNESKRVVTQDYTYIIQDTGVGLRSLIENAVYGIVNQNEFYETVKGSDIYYNVLSRNKLRILGSNPDFPSLGQVIYINGDGTGDLFIHYFQVCTTSFRYVHDEQSIDFNVGDVLDITLQIQKNSADDQKSVAWQGFANQTTGQQDASTIDTPQYPDTNKDSLNLKLGETIDLLVGLCHPLNKQVGSVILPTPSSVIETQVDDQLVDFSVYTFIYNMIQASLISINAN